ncbi:MAG: MIP/aquaporin family protein [bacterium]
MKNINQYVAECLGTMILVFVGCGAAATFGSANFLAIAFAFGLAILVVYYSIGRISGGHVNPAVSLAMYFADRMELKEMLLYWASQFIGALFGSGLLLLVLKQIPSIDITTIGLGQNGFGTASALSIKMGGAIIIEIILTCIFVLTVLSVTADESYQSVGGFVIGGVLMLVHIVGLPFTGTSVNPARSFAPALIMSMMKVSLPLSQVWVFLVAPLIGSIIATIIYNVIFKNKFF